MHEWIERWGGNRTVLALSGARMADALGNSILIIILPIYVKEVAAGTFSLPTSALVGILIALFGFTGALLQPVMGSLADRTGRRKLFVQIGLTLMGLGVLAFTVATQFSHLVVIRLLQATGFAMTVPASLAIMATATEQNTRGGSMGIFTTLRIVGFAIGPLLGGYLQVHYGFQVTFVVGAALVFLSVFVVEIWVNAENTDAAPASDAARSPLSVFNLSEVPAPLAAISVATFMMASSFAMMSPLENEFNARLDQTAIGFGVAFSALMVSRLVLQTPLGRLSDRIGRKPLVVGGLLLLVPATALMGYVSTTLQLVGARILQGSASAGVAAPAFALAADLSSAGTEGRQMSFITAGFSLGIAVGPLIAGFLASVSFALPFLIGAGGCLVGAGLVQAVVPETQREPAGA